MVESLNCAMLTKIEEQSIVTLHTEQECMYVRLNTQEARIRCHHPGICPFLLLRYLLVRWSLKQVASQVQWYYQKLFLRSVTL